MLEDLRSRTSKLNKENLRSRDGSLSCKTQRNFLSSGQKCDLKILWAEPRGEAQRTGSLR